MKKFLVLLLIFPFTAAFAQEGEGGAEDPEAAAAVEAVYPADGGSGGRAFPGEGDWDLDALDTGRDAEYLSPLEKDVLLEMNMVRGDPAKYAELYIKPKLAFFQGTLYAAPGATRRTYEGPRSVNDCVNSLNRMKPVPPLLPERGLSLAARDHALDTGKSGRTGHTGGDGSTFVRRINRYGRWKGSSAENIDYGYATGREIVLHLLIDDGVSSRGHRRNIMNGQFSRAGIAAGPHKRTEYICVIDYAQSYTSHPAKEAETAAPGPGSGGLPQ
jgi:uncharacterized protein YkwD